MSTSPEFIKELPVQVKPGETLVLRITARAEGEKFTPGSVRLEFQGDDLPDFVYLIGEKENYKVPIKNGVGRLARVLGGRYRLSMKSPPPGDAQPGSLQLDLKTPEGTPYDGAVYLSDGHRVFELESRDGILQRTDLPPGEYNLSSRKPAPRRDAGKVELRLNVPDGVTLPPRAYLVSGDGAPPVEVPLRMQDGKAVGEYADVVGGAYRLALKSPRAGGNANTDSAGNEWLAGADGKILLINFENSRIMGQAAPGVIQEMVNIVVGDSGANIKSIEFIAYVQDGTDTRIRRESEALARAKAVADAFKKELGKRRTIDVRANMETRGGSGSDSGDGSGKLEDLIVRGRVERGPLLAGPKAPVKSRDIIATQLADKEKYFFESSMKRISPMGMYHHRMYDGRDFHSMELGDSCAFGGLLLQALSFKYACTKDARSLAGIKKIVGLYQHYYEVTKALAHFNVGVEPNTVPFAQSGTGQLCRMIVRADLYEGTKSYGSLDTEFREEHRHGATHMRYIKHGDFYYRFDISMDQYINAVAGLLMCRNMVPEVKPPANTVLGHIKAQLVGNPCVKDETGNVVRYGDLSNDGRCDDPGVEEGILQWFDPLRKFLRYSVDRDYSIWPSVHKKTLEIFLLIVTLNASAKRKRQPFNELMGTGIFSSLLWDTGFAQSQWRNDLIDLLLISTTAASDEFNAYQDVWAARFDQARDNLNSFPTTDWRRVFNVAESETVVPLQERAERHCFWEHSAYVRRESVLSAEKFPWQPHHYNGHDYLVAYWSWRFFEKFPDFKGKYRTWMSEAWKRKLGTADVADRGRLESYVAEQSKLIT